MTFFHNEPPPVLHFLQQFVAREVYFHIPLVLNVGISTDLIDESPVSTLVSGRVGETNTV